MHNVFQIGGQVAGDSFIGRKGQLAALRKHFVERNVRTAKSIVGLTRTGKTSLVANAFADLPDNILYIDVNLNEWGAYEEIWQDICCTVEEYLTRCDAMDTDVQGYLSSVRTGDARWMIFSRNVKRIFEYLAKKEIKTILVLDEFDRAETLFQNETKRFELFRTLFSDSKYNISAITISRRNLYTIENATYQSSTFHGVLDIEPLKGFDAEGMQEYFAVFEARGIELDDEQKEKIIYYAGNLPYLLSILGHYIIETADEGKDIDIDSIFLNRCKAITDYYRDCRKHLERDGDLKRLIPFVIGPNVGVTKNDRDELINLGYLQIENDQFIAVSRFFTDLLSTNMLQMSIWDNVSNLEKKIKMIIERELPALVKCYQAGGTTENEVQGSILRKVKGIAQGDINRYDTFIKSNKKVFNQDSTYLDAMSLNDVVKILTDNWEGIFSRYFGDELLSKVSYRLDQCVRARNPVAHVHEEYLTDAERIEVDVFCKQFFDVFSKTIQNVDVSTESYLDVAKAFPYEALEEVEPEYSMPIFQQGDRVVLRVRAKGKNQNLRGVIEENGASYRGMIPRNYLEGLELAKFLHTKVEGTVDKIDREWVAVIPDFASQ